MSRLRAALLASTIIVGAPALSHAADIQTLGTLGGSLAFTGQNTISADGTVIVGASNTTGNLERHAFRWSGGVMTDIGTLGGTYSWAHGVSADGNVVVGEATAVVNFDAHAFSWTAAGGMVDLGTLGGNTSVAYAASANGSVIVGRSDLAGNTTRRAFRWSGGVMTDLGTLPGHTDSEAIGVSADGSVVAGNSSDAVVALQMAFRWTGGVMTGLGSLGGGASSASALSADGSTVVGTSFTAGAQTHAFRWNGGVMTDLGTLGGGQSSASAVSANGAVVVGTASDAGGISRAFRWTAANGMQSVESLLNAAGVTLAPGSSLLSATGVSADGSVIVGKYLSGPIYVARLSAAGGTGIITTNEAARSFASLGALGMTGNAAISSSLGTMSQYATQTLNGAGNSNARFSVFATAGYDTDPTTSGSLGVTMKLGGGMVAGAMIEADHIKTNMTTNGGAKMNGGGGGLFMAAMPDTGLQWLASASVLTIKGDITRGYLNGATPASSTGNTRGNGFGALARIGWAFDAMKGVKVTPFASYTLSSIKFNGYTETNGVFAAQIDDFTDRVQTSRLGADARYTFAPGKWLWGGLTWAHRIDGGKTADISGALIGLFPIGTTGVAFAKDWAEATAGVRLPLGTAGGAVTASVTASIPTRQATTYMARIGLSQSF